MGGRTDGERGGERERRNERREKLEERVRKESERASDKERGRERESEESEKKVGGRESEVGKRAELTLFNGGFDCDMRGDRGGEGCRPLPAQRPLRRARPDNGDVQCALKP